MRTLVVKVVELSILQLKKQLILQYLNLPTKKVQFTIKPIQTLSTSTCALSLGASHMARFLWTEYRASKARMLGFMWNPNSSGALMEVSEV